LIYKSLINDVTYSLIFSDIEKLEARYHNGELSATKFLDQACHFYDGWTVHTLEDSWNEEYGQYILQIDEPRSAEGFDEINQGLEDVDLDDDEPPPARRVAAAPAPAVRTFNACAVCYQELHHDNWWIANPCYHCFCMVCFKTITPARGPDESYLDYYMRCLPCPTCRSTITEAHKIFPNYLTLTEGDQFIPVVNDDEDNANAAARALAAAGAEVESEMEAEAAEARRLENQRMIRDLMHTDR